MISCDGEVSSNLSSFFFFPHVDVPVRYVLQARKLYTCIATVQFIESQSLKNQKYQSQGSYKHETPLTAYKVTYVT